MKTITYRQLLLACSIAMTACSEATQVQVPSNTGKVALVTRNATTNKAELYIQNLDGTQKTRVRFSGADDQIPGNVREVPPVTDDNILALGPLEWSPDGKRLALVVSVAFDQSEVIVIDADGSHARVASVNTQWISSDIDWSPDGTQVAYAMSTSFHATGNDLFVTDLSTNRVRRLTTGMNLSLAGIGVRWNATGSEIYLSQVTGELGTPLFNYTSRVSAVNALTGERRIVADAVVGSVDGITRAGDWMLILRKAALRTTGSYDMVLVKRAVATGVETTLSTDPTVLWAELATNEKLIVFANGDGNRPGFSTLPVTGGQSAKLTISDDATSVIDVIPDTQ